MNISGEKDYLSWKKDKTKKVLLGDLFFYIEGVLGLKLYVVAK